jgi:3-deoxy-manno-octulosonate cytidylyltransferase (CMP-KDO synthetase)
MALLVIPARYGSTRLPGKPLLRETGLPLVVHVLRQARLARRAERVVVATDDARIADAVRESGGEAVMTSAEHRSGTDRVAEAIEGLPGDVVINVQGDEPEVDPGHVDLLAAVLEEPGGPDVATLAAPVGEEEAASPHVVKVVTDREGRALYFSRSPIPYPRDGDPIRLRHAGIYAYRRETLRRLVATAPTPLERAESLEQLRALETGIAIRVLVVDRIAPGIDTREDYEAFCERWRGREGSEVEN